MASIIDAILLRTGSAGFGGDNANDEDNWLVTVDEQITKVAMLELWVAAGTYPIPKLTFKAFGTRQVVCDNVSAECANAQRYLWSVKVSWKDSSDTQPQNQTQPTPPNGAGGDEPNDWAPKVTRRPVSVSEDGGQEFFYEGGYSGEIHTLYSSKTAANERSPFTNSATTPFVDGLPSHQRKQSLWTVRWVRRTVPTTLIDAELTLNDEDVTFSHRGFTQVWTAKTALLESVSITETKWGTLNLWEIAVEIRHDADGHLFKSLDCGFVERTFEGEELPLGGYATANEYRNIKEKNGKPIADLARLNGSGKQSTDNEAVYASWRDYGLTDFAALPLLGDLLT